MRRRVLKSFTALALACIVLIGGLPSQAFAGTPAPEPVQSKKSWADAAYMLPESLAGEVTVEYDITVNKASINGVVALSSAGQNVGSWQDAQTALRAHEDGYFDVRDGGDYGSLATVAYEQGGTYSVRETVSTGASSATYSVWVNGTIIAESFLQRAATPALADVGQIVLISQTGAEADWEDGEFSLSNIKVNGSPVALSSKRNIHTEPTTLSVGPGEGYATPAAALVDAIPGDTIMIYPGTYLGADAYATVSTPNLTFVGVADGDGKYPQMDVTGYDLPNQKAAWVIQAKHIKIYNLGFRGAVDRQNSGGNHAGVRPDVASDLWFYSCEFYENNNGVLTGQKPDGDSDVWDLHFVGCNIHNNGVNGYGQVHNIYIGHIDYLYFVDSISSRAYNEGHLLKTRAANAYIANSLLYEGVNGRTYSNSAIDASEGGNLYVIGSVLQEGETDMGNPRVVSYAMEDGDAAARGQAGQNNVWFVNNTLVKQKQHNSDFLQFTGNPAISFALNMYNNAVSTVSSDSLVSRGGVDIASQYLLAANGNAVVGFDAYSKPENFDFRLKETASALRGQAVAVPEIVSTYGGTPEIVEVPASQPVFRSYANNVIGRPSFGDAGAYEYYEYDASESDIEDDDNSIPLEAGGFAASPDWQDSRGDSFYSFGTTYDAATAPVVKVDFDVKANALGSNYTIVPNNFEGNGRFLIRKYADAGYRLVLDTNGSVSWTDGSSWGNLDQPRLSVGEVYHFALEYHLGQQTYSLAITTPENQTAVAFEGALRRDGYDQVNSIQGMTFYAPLENAYTIFNLTHSGAADPTDDGGFKASANYGSNKWVFDAPASGLFTVTYVMRYIQAGGGADDLTFGLIGTPGGNWGSYTQLGYRARISGSDAHWYNGADGFDRLLNPQLEPGQKYGFKITYDLASETYSAWISKQDGTVLHVADGYGRRPGYDALSVGTGMMFYAIDANRYKIYDLQVSSGAGAEIPIPEADPGTDPGTDPNGDGFPSSPDFDAAAAGDEDASRYELGERYGNDVVEVAWDMVINSSDGYGEFCPNELHDWSEAQDGSDMWWLLKKPADAGFRAAIWYGLGLRAHNGGNGFEMSYPSNPLEPGVKYHVVAEYNLKYQSYSIHVYDETGESVLRSMENFSRRSGYDQVDYIDSMNFYSEEEGFYTVYNVTSRGWDLEDPDDGRFPSSPYPEANKYLFHGANDDLLAYEGTVVVDFDLRVNAPMDGNANSFGIIGPGGGNWDSFAQLGYRARFAGTMLQAYNADGFYYEQSTTLNPGDLYHITLTAVLPEYRYSLTATDSGGNTRIIADGYSGRNGYDQIAGAYGLIFASPGVDDYSVYNVSVRQEEYVPDDPVEPGSGRRLTVGSGGSYSAIQDAIDASEPGDVILINANDEWHNTGALAVVNKPDITIRGVASLDDESSTSKKAIMSVDPGVILQRKGIWIVTGPAAHVYIENIEFAGAHDTDAQDKNWSGVRVETAVGLVFRGCAFHNNDDGVLAGAGGAGSGVAFYRCEFYENGFGDGQSHNLYIGKVESLYFIDSYSHYPNADAHILKSRAANNYIINSVLAEENADSEHFSNSNIDISEGGNLYVAGCTLHQATVPETGAGWGNYSVVTYGLENGAANPGRDVAFVNNTVVDDMWDEAEAQWGPVLAFGGAVAPESVALAMRNNLYAGKAPVVIFANGGRADLTDEYFAAESGNLIVRDIAEIAFRNAAAFDYRLTSGSVAAIDKGVAPEPENEAMGAYFESRAVHGAAIDIGAYEFDGASDPGDHGDGATQEEIGRLERLARRADGLIHELYTANSATALEKAAADALALVGAGESGGGAPTKAGIAGARQAITAALRGLRIADQYDNRRYYEALAAEVARAEELDPEKYTAASWERVETPLANAWSDLTNEFVFEPQSAPQGAVGGNSGLLPFDISYTDPQIAAERNKIIQDLLALRAALDNLEAHPEYDPSDLPTLTVGVHEAKSEEWLLVQQPGEPVIGFSVKSDSGASGAAEIHLRLSYSAADFEALEVLFAENGGGFEKFVSLPSELGGATLTKPARMKTPLFDGYLTYSVSIVAEAGNAFDVGEGGAILDIALPLLNPGAGGSKAVSLILSNLEATVYPDGYGDIGGGAAISDVNVSIGPFVATTIIRYRDRFDVTLDGRLTLADVAMVRRCMGLKADGGGIWTPAEAERCDLGGKEGDIDVDMPDGEIDTSDLTLIMAAYEATLL